MEIFFIYPSELRVQATYHLIPMATSPFKKCCIKTWWYSTKKHSSPLKVSLYPFEMWCCTPACSDPHVSVYTCRRYLPKVCSTHTMSAVYLTSPILCYLHKLWMYALKQLKTMLNTTISYKSNTHKRHLWIFEDFWMHLINKSIIISQKFTLTREL